MRRYEDERRRQRGTCAARNASSPLMSGKRMSQSARSGQSAHISFMACLPLCHHTTRQPSSSRARCKDLPMIGSSSTTAMHPSSFGMDSLHDKLVVDDRVLPDVVAEWPDDADDSAQAAFLQESDFASALGHNRIVAKSPAITLRRPIRTRSGPRIGANFGGICPPCARQCFVPGPGRRAPGMTILTVSISGGDRRCIARNIEATATGRRLDRPFASPREGKPIGASRGDMRDDRVRHWRATPDRSGKPIPIAAVRNPGGSVLTTTRVRSKLSGGHTNSPQAASRRSA